MSSLPLVDTNVLVRHIMADEARQSPLASAYFQRIEQGVVSARLTDQVVFETVHVLQSVYRVSRPIIRDAVWAILRLPGVKLRGKTIYRKVFDLFVSQSSLSFVDCYHPVLVQRLKLPEIVSFDRGFDRVPGIVRAEPS